MILKKKPIASGLKFLWLNFVGRDLQSKVLARLIKANELNRSLSFEDEIKRFHKALIILPDRPYDAALIQNTLCSLKSRKGSMVEVVAETGARDLIKSNPDIDGGFFFAEREYRYNHPAFQELLTVIQRRNYDACFLMKQEASPLDLLLAAATRAPLRVGFHVPNAFPFLNLCIRPSRTTELERDKYESMLRTLGIKILRSRIQWNLPRTAEKDAEGVLVEAGLNPTRTLLGINLTPAISGQTFPEHLLKGLLKELETWPGADVVLFHAGYRNDPPADIAKSVGLTSLNFPAHHVTFAAAFSGKFALIVSLNNLFYQLATMTGRKVIGLFESLEYRRWANLDEGRSEQVTAVTLEKMDPAAIAEVIKRMLPVPTTETRPDNG